MKPKRRYYKIDGWRGYFIPALAVAGASDTGSWDDSPCPSWRVKAELAQFQRDVLLPIGIKSKTRYGQSSNVFCMKRWLVVKPEDFELATEAVRVAIAKRGRQLKYVHDANPDSDT